MAALDFPASPTVGQIYTANGRSWKWDGVSWISANQITSIGVTGSTLTIYGSPIAHPDATSMTFANSVTLTAASTKTLTLNGGAGSNGLVIDASNNVGIGTTPSVRFTVSNNSSGAYVTSRIENLNTGGYAQQDFLIGAGGSAGQASVSYAPGIFFAIGPSANDTTTPIVFRNNNATTQMTLNASGNLGLGVTPSAWSAYKVLQVSNGSIANYSPTQDMRMSSNAYHNSGWKYVASAPACQYLLDGSNGTHAWFTAGSGTAGNAISFNQAMTLDASGHLTLNSGGGIKFVNGAGSLSTTTNGDGVAFGYVTTGIILQGKGYSYDVCLLNNSAGVAGYVATGATTITTSSDERLKENLEPIVNAISKIEQIRAVTGNYKADPDRNVAFLIAQDVDKVFPQAVEKADNNSWGINYNWVIPLLAAAIQELSAELNELKQRIK